MDSDEAGRIEDVYQVGGLDVWVKVTWLGMIKSVVTMVNTGIS